jgi:succinate dehydrogenase cytochrome b subunit
MVDKTSVLHKNRPLSPHITIYKPQITSVLSILHRMTGVYLYLGMMIFTWWIILVVYSSFNPEVADWGVLTTKIGLLLVFGWGYSFFYHLLNGVRHLFWDMGLGFEKKSVLYSGIVTVMGSVALTALTWYIAYID